MTSRLGFWELERLESIVYGVLLCQQLTVRLGPHLPDYPSTVSLFFHAEGQELWICLSTGYEHRWLLEMHSLQTEMEDLARRHGATGRVTGSRWEDDDGDTGHSPVF